MLSDSGVPGSGSSSALFLPTLLVGVHILVGLLQQTGDLSACLGVDGNPERSTDRHCRVRRQVLQRLQRLTDDTDELRTDAAGTLIIAGGAEQDDKLIPTQARHEILFADVSFDS